MVVEVKPFRYRVYWVVIAWMLGTALFAIGNSALLSAAVMLGMIWFFDPEGGNP